MQQQFDEYGTPTSASPERPGAPVRFNPRTAALAFAFATFVLGGFAFGWLFMTNWKLLSAFQIARLPSIAGPIVSIAQAPSITGITRPQATVTVPQQRDQNGTPIPVAEAKPEDNLDNLKDLPAWMRSSRLNILLLGIDH